MSREPITERKKRMMHSVRDRLGVMSDMRLEEDLARAKTHADLDRIEDDLESSEAASGDECYD